MVDAAKQIPATTSKGRHSHCTVLPAMNCEAPENSNILFKDGIGEASVPPLVSKLKGDEGSSLFEIVL